MDLGVWIGQVIAAGGGATLIAYGLFKFLGQNWIKNQLAKDLEAAKAEISFHAAKRLRLHDKEYEVFPEIWSRLVKARDSLSASIASFITLPDFTRMTDEQIQEWADQTDLERAERAYFIEQRDKALAFSRIIEFRNIREAENRYTEFRDYLQANRIFLSPDVSEKFDQIQGSLREAWASKKVDLDSRGETGKIDFLLKAFEQFENEVKPQMADLEKIVQKRFFPESG
jgi:hypothetical protein